MVHRYNTRNNTCHFRFLQDIHEKEKNKHYYGWLRYRYGENYLTISLQENSIDTKEWVTRKSKKKIIKMFTATNIAFTKNKKKKYSM